MNTTVVTFQKKLTLPRSESGLILVVTNKGPNSMRVYGAGSDLIDDIATGVSQMAKSTVLYCCVSPGKWYSEGMATGFQHPTIYAPQCHYCGAIWNPDDSGRCKGCAAPEIRA